MFSAPPQRPLFRQAALERLETPEPSDAPVIIPPSRAWGMVAGVVWLGACTLAALLLR